MDSDPEVSPKVEAGVDLVPDPSLGLVPGRSQDRSLVHALGLALGLNLAQDLNRDPSPVQYLGLDLDQGQGQNLAPVLEADLGLGLVTAILRARKRK